MAVTVPAPAVIPNSVRLPAPANPPKTKQPYNPAEPFPDSVMVWLPPNGEVEHHTRQNARDLVRHNGWMEGAPHVKADPKTSAEDAQTMLEELRAEAGKLAIRIDATWGHKKLQTEIDKVKAAAGAMIPDVVKKMEEVKRLQDAEDAAEKAEAEKAAKK